jgi:hypothetical protein
MPGNTVIVDPRGAVMAGPVREEGRVVSAELDLDLVRTERRLFDPVVTTTIPMSSVWPSIRCGGPSL